MGRSTLGSRAASAFTHGRIALKSSQAIPVESSSFDKVFAPSQLSSFVSASLQRDPAAAAKAGFPTFTLTCFGFASSRFGMLSVSTPF